MTSMHSFGLAEIYERTRLKYQIDTCLQSEIKDRIYDIFKDIFIQDSEIFNERYFPHYLDLKVYLTREFCWFSELSCTNGTMKVFLEAFLIVLSKYPSTLYFFLDVFICVSCQISSYFSKGDKINTNRLRPILIGLTNLLQMYPIIKNDNIFSCATKILIEECIATQRCTALISCFKIYNILSCVHVLMQTRGSYAPFTLLRTLLMRLSCIMRPSHMMLQDKQLSPYQEEILNDIVHRNNAKIYETDDHQLSKSAPNKTVEEQFRLNLHLRDATMQLPIKEMSALTGGSMPWLNRDLELWLDLMSLPGGSMVGAGMCLIGWRWLLDFSLARSHRNHFSSPFFLARLILPTRDHSSTNIPASDEGAGSAAQLDWDIARCLLLLSCASDPHSIDDLLFYCLSTLRHSIDALVLRTQSNHLTTSRCSHCEDIKTANSAMYASQCDYSFSKFCLDCLQCCCSRLCQFIASIIVHCPGLTPRCVTVALHYISSLVIYIKETIVSDLIQISNHLQIIYQSAMIALTYATIHSLAIINDSNDEISDLRIQLIRIFDLDDTIADSDSANLSTVSSCKLTFGLFWPILLHTVLKLNVELQSKECFEAGVRNSFLNQDLDISVFLSKYPELKRVMCGQVIRRDIVSLFSLAESCGCNILKMKSLSEIDENEMKALQSVLMQLHNVNIPLNNQIKCRKVHLSLPVDIWVLILSYLSPKRVCRMSGVSKVLNEASNSLTLWQYLYIKYLHGTHKPLDCMNGINRNESSLHFKVDNVLATTSEKDSIFLEFQNNMNTIAMKINESILWKDVYQVCCEYSFPTACDYDTTTVLLHRNDGKHTALAAIVCVVD